MGLMWVLGGWVFLYERCAPVNRRPQTGTADDLVYRAAKILDRFRVKRERSNFKGFKDFSLNAKTRILP